MRTWVGNLSTFRMLAVRDLLLRQELGFILSEREQKNYGLGGSRHQIVGRDSGLKRKYQLQVFLWRRQAPSSFLFCPTS